MNDHSIVIRDIRPGEAAEVKKMACSNFSIVERLFIIKPKLGIVAEMPDGTIGGGMFLVVVQSGQRKVGCVDIAFVMPKFRGSGIAKLLYHAAVEKLHALGCSSVMALVRGDNSQSLRRFETEGLRPVSLNALRKHIGLSATAMLFTKTASLACATGCLLLLEGATKKDIGNSANNIVRVFLTNGILLLLGVLVSLVFNTVDLPWWNLLASLVMLTIVILGETIGRLSTKKTWEYMMPGGGLIPSTIAGLLGGLYPMLGHWYLKERSNTDAYRKDIAAPAKYAWFVLLIITFVFGIFNKINPFFSYAYNVGLTLLLLYMLPFYPFDTFAGRRVREYDARVYGALVTFSIILEGINLFDILPSII